MLQGVAIEEKDKTEFVKHEGFCASTPFFCCCVEQRRVPRRRCLYMLIRMTTAQLLCNMTLLGAKHRGVAITYWQRYSDNDTTEVILSWLRPTWTPANTCKL